MATRYDERNAHAQCPRCNTFGEGQQYRHGRYVEQLHGEGAVDELFALSESVCKLGKGELDEIAAKYKGLAGGLLEEKGLK